MKPDETMHPQLQRFLEGPTVSARAEAVTALLAERILARSSSSPEFALGLNRLIHAASKEAGAQDRLLAIAQLVRISQALRPLARQIRDNVAPLLAEPLPALNLLKAGDDRAYVAQACRWTTADWVISYAAQGAVLEETAEKARAELIGVLFTKVPFLSDVLFLLREPLSRWKPDTDEPSNSLARRLTRILAAIRNGLATSRVSPGTKPGEALSELIRLPLEVVGYPSEDLVAISLARETVLLVHDIVRSRFSLATDPTAYSAVRVVRRLFGSAGWPGKFHDELESLIELMLEAILLLAKQGIAAESIAEQLVLVVDHLPRAESLMNQLATTNPDIPESVRSWLKKEPSHHTSIDLTRLSASQDLRADPSVGEALRQSQRLHEDQQLLRSSVLPSLSVLDPSLVPLVERLYSRIEAIVRSVREIALVRRIMLFGAVGTELRYQPKFFEVADGTPKEVVRVLRPAVVRIAPDGSPGEVVLKGLVE